MEQTQNYQLSQWEGRDRILMEDFNGDNAKIDAALKAEAEARAAGDDAEAAARQALAGQVAKCGNCQIWTTTYKGTGTYGADHPTSLTFPKKPVLAFIAIPGSSDPMWLLPKAGTLGTPTYNSLIWSGATATWYSSGSSASAYNQLNASSVTYYVVALLEADK